MLTRLLLPILLSGCGLLGESEPTEPVIEKPAGAVPDKAALNFYCDFMLNLNPADLRDVPAEERQSVIATQLAEAATAAGVNGWATFHTNLKARSARDRQDWVEFGVQEHGLQEACIAARPRHALNPEEQNTLRTKRMDMMKAATEAAANAAGAAEDAEGAAADAAKLLNNAEG
jgi:hypothetical protein